MEQIALPFAIICFLALFFFVVWPFLLGRLEETSLLILILLFVAEMLLVRLGARVVVLLDVFHDILIEHASSSGLTHVFSHAVSCGTLPIQVLFVTLLVELLRQLLLLLLLHHQLKLLVSFFDLSEFKFHDLCLLVHFFLFFANLRNFSASIVHGALDSSPLVDEA